MKVTLLILLITTSVLNSHMGAPPRALITNDEELKMPEEANTIPNLLTSNIKCNQEMLISYGMEGYQTAEIEAHPFCPKISENCCKRSDAEKSKNLWNNQFKFYIERYYSTYLYSLKYVLGYSAEAYLLALEFENSNILECKNKAVDLISMNLNPKTTQVIYNEISTAVRGISKMRSGFYCVLCNAKTQEKLQDFWSTTNRFNNDRIYMSKSFCEKLVEGGIQASFYTVFYLKRYLDDLATLINCKTKNSIELEFEIPLETRHQIKNCYYFRHRYFFFFCEKFCEHFHITKASEAFDGDLQQIKKFVDHIMVNRHEAFKYPNNNLLTDGVNFEEDILKFNYGVVFKDLVFFRPTTQQVMLDKFNTDVVYYGGMDPWESIEDNKYSLIIGAAGIIRMWVVMVLFMMVNW